MSNFCFSWNNNEFTFKFDSTGKWEIVSSNSIISGTIDENVNIKDNSGQNTMGPPAFGYSGYSGYSG